MCTEPDTTVKMAQDDASMGIADLYIWVYQFEVSENGTHTRHTVYRTRDSIEKRGGVILHQTGKQVPGYEITEGMWKPDRTPLA